MSETTTEHQREMAHAAEDEATRAAEDWCMDCGNVSVGMCC